MSEPVVRAIRIAEASPLHSGFAPASFNRLGTEAHRRSDEAASDAPREDRFSLGFEEGQRAAERVFEEERLALVRLAENANALQPEPSEELASLIGETVFRLVSEIVGSVEIDQARLSQRAEACAAIIAECDNARTIFVHPDDLPMLEGLRSELKLAADPLLSRGDIRIDCSAGWIEHGTSLYLGALRSELGLEDDKR